VSTCAHDRALVDALLQPARAIASVTFLLASAAFADRAGIDAAVAGIDRRRSRRDHVRIVADFTTTGGAFDASGLRSTTGDGRSCRRRDVETARRRRASKVDHEAQVACALRSDAQLLHEALPFGTRSRASTRAPRCR
jgi:hypothetical protein